MARRSLRRRVLVGALVTVVLTIAGMIGMRLAIENADRRNAQVTHTLDVIVGAERLARRAGEAQAAMRGALLLRDPQLATAFTTQTEAFGTEAVALAQLVADNPAQIERIDEIRRAFADWEVVVGGYASKPDALTDADRGRLAEGSARMAQIRQLVDAFVSVERALLVSRRDASQTAGRWLGVGVLVLVAVAVTVACLTAFSLALRVARDTEKLANAAAAVADGDLERRIEFGGNDELALAGTAFNAMAERLRQRHDDEVVLGKMRDMLQASHTTTEAKDIVARLAPQCLPVPAARLYIINASRNLLAPSASWGETKLLRADDEGFAPDDCWAIRNGRPHVVSDSAHDITCPHRHDEAGPSVCLPLVAQGETVGVLYLATSDLPHLGREVGEMIALTLANLRLREVLRNQAIRDPLTGLFNRRYLEETLVREVSRVRRKKSTLAVIVLDVDHFKRFNDTYGHHGGDVMLREVGSVLAKAFRDSDIICRFGGEEFVVVAPECTVEAAVARTEEMRARVRAISVTIDGRQVSGVSISAGIAMFPLHGETPDALFQAADRAVYRSKSDGRDRTTIA